MCLEIFHDLPFFLFLFFFYKSPDIFIHLVCSYIITEVGTDLLNNLQRNVTSLYLHYIAAMRRKTMRKVHHVI